MSVYIIRPEDIKPPYSNVIEKHYKVVFLAGPIKGTWDWQSEATSILTKLWTMASPSHDLVIANPRCVAWHGDFNRQVDWESYNLSRADVIMFWLAAERDHDCHRAFAQTTRFELGEHAHKQKTMIGLECGFTGEKYIRRRLGDARIHEDMITMCECIISYITCPLSKP